MRDPLSYIHDLTWQEIPPDVIAAIKRNLLDLIGVGISGRSTELAQIITHHAQSQFGGRSPLFLSAGTASPAGVALAAGMTIDAMDGHDGYNPSKGHIGCTSFSALYALAREASGKEALTTLVMAYEFGARAAEAQHATVPDYHTSGSWGAVTTAAIGARLLALSQAQTRHALGIAEYHGPRSQMMRVIDHPTMLKDGSGWGAMAGVSAAFLAQAGFTGAPAITVEITPAHWETLGREWKTLQQYFKPYPVCRWAQPPIEAALALKSEYGFRAEQITSLKVETFHESIRLACRAPKTTEEAQYSTSFPCAVALVYGTVGPEHVTGRALENPEVLRLSHLMEFEEHPEANAVFPLTRKARATIELSDGRVLMSDWQIPQWDYQAPPSDAAIIEKFNAFTQGLISPTRARAIIDTVMTLETVPFAQLAALLSGPINLPTNLGSAA